MDYPTSDKSFVFWFQYGANGENNEYTVFFQKAQQRNDLILVSIAIKKIEENRRDYLSSFSPFFFLSDVYQNYLKKS